MKYVYQYTDMVDRARTPALGFQETQDWHPEAHIIARRRGMDEAGNLLVASQRQESRRVKDVVLGLTQRDDSASARAVR